MSDICLRDMLLCGHRIILFSLSHHLAPELENEKYFSQFKPEGFPLDVCTDLTFIAFTSLEAFSMWNSFLCPTWPL